MIPLLFALRCLHTAICPEGIAGYERSSRVSCLQIQVSRLASWVGLSP